MNSFIFFLGAVLLLSVSYLLMKATHPHYNGGVGNHEWRQFWRVVAKVLLVTAGLALIIAAMGLVESLGPTLFQN